MDRRGSRGATVMQDPDGEQADARSDGFSRCSVHVSSLGSGAGERVHGAASPARAYESSTGYAGTVHVSPIYARCTLPDLRYAMVPENPSAVG